MNCSKKAHFLSRPFTKIVEQLLDETLKIALVQCYDENFPQYFITIHSIVLMALCEIGVDVTVLTNHYDPGNNIFSR